MHKAIRYIYKTPWFHYKCLRVANPPEYCDHPGVRESSKWRHGSWLTVAWCQLTAVSVDGSCRMHRQLTPRCPQEHRRKIRLGQRCQAGSLSEILKQESSASRTSQLREAIVYTCGITRSDINVRAGRRNFTAREAADDAAEERTRSSAPTQS